MNCSYSATSIKISIFERKNNVGSFKFLHNFPQRIETMISTSNWNRIRKLGVLGPLLLPYNSIYYFRELIMFSNTGIRPYIVRESTFGQIDSSALLLIYFDNLGGIRFRTERENFITKKHFVWLFTIYIIPSLCLKMKKCLLEMFPTSSEVIKRNGKEKNLIAEKKKFIKRNGEKYLIILISLRKFCLNIYPLNIFFF